MTVMLWLILGGVIGWVAGVVMDNNDRLGMGFDIVVGIVGAVVGGWLLSPLFGLDEVRPGQLTMGGLGVSVLGAVVLLAMTTLVRRGKIRWSKGPGYARYPGPDLGGPG